MTINYETVKSLIESNDNFYILTHQSPDGDTLGSGFALVNLLRSLGKKANVLNSDGFPARYQFLYEGYEPEFFEPQYIIAVDVADEKLFGNELEEYSDKIDLCIDHHISNTFYAKNTILNSNASATCEVMYEIFSEMNVEINDIIAKCLYTGIATDTGCFKYENTTKRSHEIASDLMSYNINYPRINRLMFDVKSKGRVMVEQIVSRNMEFYLNDKCSMITIDEKLINESGIEAAEFDGLASITLQVESVEVGVTIKQRDENSYKVSMRASDKVDVSALCQKFGGGGHKKAAGCLIKGNITEVKARIVQAVKEALEII